MIEEEYLEERQNYINSRYEELKVEYDGLLEDSFDSCIQDCAALEYDYNELKKENNKLKKEITCIEKIAFRIITILGGIIGCLVAKIITN